jgi:hypothetical protein
MKRKLYICDHVIFCNLPPTLHIKCRHSIAHVPFRGNESCWIRPGSCPWSNTDIQKECIETESFTPEEE